MNKIITLLILCLSFLTASGAETSRPRLLLTKEGVREIKAQLGRNPLTDAAFAKAKAVADAAVAGPVEVPVPKDVGGGYTHEKHKQNYTDMYNAGVVYQLTGDKKYAAFVRRMLLAYAELYPSLPVHPARFTKTPGKIFYQVLNEAVWLTFAANAYDCVYEYIPAAERRRIENDLFRPVVEFMENGLPANNAAFNSMHNFGTWMTAGTGMIGYVMDDREMIDKALNGSAKDGKTGFLPQLDVLFSPEGYYDEGPGYQRYAIYPFVTFAECINNNQPELHIFDYRGGILRKAVNTLLQCTYEGDIFLMNDAIAKDIHTYEILFSTNIAYKTDPKEKGMLGMVERQGIVTLTDAGAAAAKAIAKGEAKPFAFRSEIVKAGPDGNDGGLAIIRGNDANNSCVTLKATTHGGGHGHFDRLSTIFFANGTTIVPDYGSARFINVVAKAKGGYAPENKSFAQLSIAHNTVVVDSTTHFRGISRDALKTGAAINFDDFSDPAFQIVSATENNAYKGVSMNRSIALVRNEALEYAFVLDIFRLTADREHVYDLPYYYNGHFMSSNYAYDKNVARLEPMGRRNGYQHLWKEATGHPKGSFMQLCWLENKQFYTLSTAVSTPCTPYLVKTGANDPDYNLVTRNGVLLRTSSPVANHTYVSVIEPHGNYDLVTETTRDAESKITDLTILHDADDYTFVRITTKQGKRLLIAVVNSGYETQSKHVFQLGSERFEWTGNYALFNR